MKKVLFMMLTLAMVGVACEKEHGGENNDVSNKELNEATAMMSELINQGSGFDAETIDLKGFWYLDALMGYNSDFSKVKEIFSQIGGDPWQEQIEPVVQIRGEEVARWELVSGNDLQVTQSGSIEYYSRAALFYINLSSSQSHASLTIDGKILAYTDDSIVVEWQSNNNYYRALLKRIDESVMIFKEASLKLDAMLQEAGELNREAVESLLVGTWVGDTRLEYDENYEAICFVDELCGLTGWTPNPPRFEGAYTVNADGTMSMSFETNQEPFETVKYNYTWSYASDTNTLTVVDPWDTTWELKVVALSDKWLFVDYVEINSDSNGAETGRRYLRDVFKRVE
jgi:hypothetical protein